ncbi:zinc metalloproteinase nas-4-like [Chaetoceros tenuissimus]|uniref:Metalloendopeptidase n=1 Tax=Chaetoceros tenuissimus TaxID=426638 RepID=A0AAD3CJP2_9STRA|nr:zinc metalloproteinase nas-4-like [Chaetoceros tenuissimus]
MIHPQTADTRRSNPFRIIFFLLLLSWQIQAVQSRLRATKELLDEQYEEDEVIDVDLSGQHHNDGDEEGVFIEGDILATWDSISQVYSPEYALELGLHPPPEENNNTNTIDIFKSKEAIVENLTASNSTEPIEKQEITAKMTPLPPPSSNAQPAPLNPPDEPAPFIPEEDYDPKPHSIYWADSFDNDIDMYRFHVYVSKEVYPNDQFKKIKKALRQMCRLTGVMHIQFYRTQEPPEGIHYIRIIKDTGCWSRLGQTNKAGGVQALSLASGCLYRRGTIQHEFLHALGYYHAHMRPDRDDYVTINEENIQDGKHKNFRIAENSSTLGTQYDYGSVLHYSSYAFSKNREPTIDANGNAIGQRDKLSPGDRLLVRLHYQCSDGPRTLEEYKNETCNDSNCKCGFKMKGCGGESNKCKGNLVCRNDKCLKSVK